MKQAPLPLSIQKERAELRAAEHAARNPVAPVYRDIPDRTPMVRGPGIGRGLDLGIPAILPIIAASFRLMQARAAEKRRQKVAR